MKKRYGEREGQLMLPKLAFSVIMVPSRITKDWERLEMPIGNE